MKQRFIHLLLISGFLLWLPAAMAQTYKVGLVEWMAWMTAHIAAEKGFWQAEDLDIKVVQFSNYDRENLLAFRNHKTDFAILMLGSAVEMITKKPQFTIIYEHDWSHGGDLFIVSKQFETVEALKGQRIGTYSRSAPIGFFANKLLQKAELSIQDIDLVEIVNTRHLNGAFRAGKVSAIINFDPAASEVVQDGTGRVLLTSADFDGVIPEGIAVQKDLLRSKPEVVRKFMRGWLKALKWQIDPSHQAEFLALAQKTMFKGQSLSDEALLTFMAGSRIHSDLKTIEARNTTGINQYLQELLAYLKQTGLKVTNEQTVHYIDTHIALEEAREIFQ
jgi:NitT/TauT family transport system substrate-binding protein